MEIELGVTDNSKVIYNTESAGVNNKHILCVGSSGGGKTVVTENIILQIVEQGGTVVVIDMHGTLSDDQIFVGLRERFEMYRNDTYANRGGVPINLFECLTYQDGETETPFTASCAISDLISRGLKLNKSESTALRIAIEDVMRNNTYEEKGFMAIGDSLRAMATKEAEHLYERMRPLFVHNAFVYGDTAIIKGKINIIHLSRLDLSAQEVMAELILSYVWRCANAEQYKNGNELFLFVDECQSYNCDAKSSLALMLSEGRKLCVNLLLCTQMVLKGTTSALQQRLSQAGLILYFKPKADRMMLTARDISPDNAAEWALELRRLIPGEFVAVGNLYIDKLTYPITYPIKVNGRID